MNTHRAKLFLELIAEMQTEEEINEATDDEGMSGDDAVMTLSELIVSAREILKDNEK